MRSQSILFVFGVLLASSGAHAQVAEEFNPPRAACCLINNAQALAGQLQDWNQLSRYHQADQDYKKEFPSQDDLVVVVESESMEKNRQFVERLGAKLEAETNYFTDVFFRGDPKMMGPKALLFFPKDDLKSLCSALGDYLPFIKQFTQATNLDSLFGLINSQFLHAKRETNAENDSLVKAVHPIAPARDIAAEVGHGVVGLAHRDRGGGCAACGRCPRHPGASSTRRSHR